jgi:hypothetical protein
MLERYLKKYTVPNVNNSNSNVKKGASTSIEYILFSFRDEFCYFRDGMIYGMF